MLGRVTLVWNDCHSAVFTIFHDLSGMTWENSQAVFFSLQADQAQRRMTRALMRQVLASENDQPMLEHGEKLLKNLDDLAKERNVATHTMWAVLMPDREITPHPSMPRSSRLQKDFKTQFEKLTMKLAKLLRALIQFNAALSVHLGSIRDRRGQ
jgi:hypothetical protein